MAESLPLFVISAPSGGGKTTVIESIQSNPRLTYAISATTRAPRKGETEGKEYYFISKEAFLKKIKENAFIEWAEVHGHYYGTLWSEIQRAEHEKKSLILDLDVQGGIHLKQQKNEAILIFLMPPSMKELESRLRNRKTDSESIIETRLKNAKTEIEAAVYYDYQIINQRLEETIEAVQTIINKTLL